MEPAVLSSLLARYPAVSVQNILSLLAEAQAPSSTIRPLIPPDLASRTASIRADYHQALSGALGLYGRNPQFQEAVGKALRVPPKVSKIEWVLCATLEMYSMLVLAFGLLHGRCTDGSCPTMNASEEISYAWADGESVKTPLTVSAQKYVQYLNEWIISKLQNAALFPPHERVSKKHILPLLKIMAKKLFRIFSHIYFCHWSFIMAIDYTAILTTTFLISYHTCISCKLLDLKADATTLDPVLLLRKQLGIPGCT